MVDRERRSAFGIALLLHVVVIGLLMFSMSRKPDVPELPSAKPIVQARAVTEAEVMEPVRKREADAAERERRLEEQKQQAEEEQRRAEEARRQAEAEAQQKAAEEARQHAAEQKRQAELKKKQEAEKARQAAERKKAEAERQRQQELKRKQEADRKAAEEKRKADEARKKREAEEKRRREAELKAKMAAEADRLAKERLRYRQQQLVSIQMQYMADIKNKVERNWLQPTGSRGTHCRVLIHQIPGGDVVDVRLTECDGDVAFQRSVEAAVRKASPLPPPPDPEVFDREIEFVFEP